MKPLAPNLQTARVAWIHESQWANHPSESISPQRMAMLLQEAERGDITAQADLFSDIEERDAHIQSEIGKRRRAVTQLPWQLVDKSDATPAEKANAKKLHDLIESIEELPQLLFDLTDAIGKGFSAVEQEWTRRRDGLAVPRRFHFREQRMFRVSRFAGSDEICLNDMTANGQRLQPLGWIVHQSKSRSGSIVRAPLFRSLAWAWLPKVFALADWSEFLEVYGYPIRLGKYDPGVKDEERDTLMQAVVDIGRRAGGIIPRSMTIDLLDAVTGDPETFARMVEKQDKYISTLILGATLTSGADGKSSTNALGQVHNEVRLDIRDDDAQNLAATLTRDLVFALAQVNGWFDDPMRCPRWQFDTQQPEDLKLYADALPQLVDIGMQIDLNWAHERLKIPKAASPADALKSPTRPPEQNRSIATSNRESRSGNFAGAHPAHICALTGDSHSESAALQSVDALERAVEPVLGDWLAQIKLIVERAESLEQMRNQLIDAYGMLPVEQMAAAMEQGFALRAAQGVLDVQQESGT